MPRRKQATSVATPFQDITWARAWQHVTTERVTATRLIQWPLPDGTHHLQLHNVGASPLWTALEGDAGVAPVWDGPVTYGGTLYAEYGGLPGAPAAVLAEAVDRGLLQARDWGTSALVITNLTPAETIRWQRARPADARIRLYWAQRAQLAPSMDDFVIADGAHRSVRRKLRQQWRKATRGGLILRILHGREVLPILPQLTAMARETSQRHGPALYGTDMLVPLADVPGAYAVVADHPDGIAGALLCFRGSENGGTDYLWTAAIDQDRARELGTYAWLMYSAIEHACCSGSAVLDAGRGNYRYKARLGLTTHELTCLVYLTRTNPALRLRLEAMHEGLHAHAREAWGEPTQLHSDDLATAEPEAMRHPAAPRPRARPLGLD